MSKARFGNAFISGLMFGLAVENVIEGDALFAGNARQGRRQIRSGSGGPRVAVPRNPTFFTAAGLKWIPPEQRRAPRGMTSHYPPKEQNR